MPLQHKVIVIGGPTASGKSGLALSVAKELNGCIINADSMQLYDGLGILTAQPSSADLAEAPHRLYAALPAEGTCTAARWGQLALAEIDKALAEGLVPIVTGGTGFYIRTLLEGISPIPDVPAEVREKGVALQRQLGTPAFHAELAGRDPETAAGLEPFNTQRLVRAWEVLESTGKGLKAWQAIPPVPPAHLSFLTVALLPPRETLYAQCDGRFTQMLAAGALEEVKEFRPRAREGMQLINALGYSELCRYLDGEISLDDAATFTKTRTRNYAKRQVTWFRHQMVPDLTLNTPDEKAVIAAFG